MEEEYKVDGIERADDVERTDDVERVDDGDSYYEHEMASRAVTFTPEVTNNVYLTLGYENTSFTRQYKFADVSNEALSSVSSKVQAYNADVPASDKAVFVSDDGDQMTSITAATIEIVTTEYIIKR